MIKKEKTAKNRIERATIKTWVTGLALVTLVLVSGFLSVKVFFSQGTILDAILTFFSHNMILEASEREVDLSAYGTEVLSFSDLMEGPIQGRSKEKGGITLVYDLDEPLQPGRYYVYLSGKTTGKGGTFRLGFMNTEDGDSYYGDRFFSEREMEIYLCMNLEKECDRFYIVWNNKDAIPCLTGLKVAALPEGTDLATVPQGCYQVGNTPYTETIDAEKAALVQGNVTDAVVVGDSMYYAIDNILYCFEEKESEENPQEAVLKSFPQKGEIISIEVGEQGELYLAMGDKGFAKWQTDGKQRYYDSTLFMGEVRSVHAVEEYLFVNEGNCGTEVFRQQGEALEYVSTLFVNNERYAEKCLIYHHSAYVLGGGIVNVFNISNISAPQNIDTISLDSGISDIQLQGDRLLLYTNRNGLTWGKGMYYYQLELGGGGRVMDGWRGSDEEHEGAVVSSGLVLGDSLYLAMGQDGMRRTARNATTEQEDKKVRILGEHAEEGFYPVHEVIPYGDELLLVSKGKGIYYYEEELPEVKVQASMKMKTKDKGRDYERFENALGEGKKVSFLAEGETVKGVAFVQDCLFILTNTELSLYDPQTKEMLDSLELAEPLSADTSLTMAGEGEYLLLLRDRTLSWYGIKGRKIVKYGEKQVTSAEEAMPALEMSDNGQIYLCGDSYLRQLVLERESLHITSLSEGQGVRFWLADVEGEEGEAGYTVFADSAGNHFYLPETGEGLVPLRLIETEELTPEELDRGWKRTVWLGYYLVEPRIYFDEEGVAYSRCRYYEISWFYGWDVAWRGLSLWDAKTTKAGVHLETFGRDNVIFRINATDCLSPKLLNRLYVGEKIYSLDSCYRYYAIAAGRKGIILYEK